MYTVETSVKNDACIKRIIGRKGTARKSAAACKCVNCDGTGTVWLIFTCDRCMGKGKFLYTYLFW